MIKGLAASLGHLAGVKNLAPVYLISGATWRCNARCSTCFNHEKLNRTDAKELTVDEHDRIARNMGALMWLLFTGGEPILRDDLAEVALAYYRRCGLRRITIPTNGLLPEKTVETVKTTLALLPRANIAVSLALDAIGDELDAIRGVKGAYEKLIGTYDALAYLKKHQPRLSLNLNTVLTNRNIGAIPTLIENVIARMPDADFHGFELLRGSPPDSELETPTADEYELLLMKLTPYWSRYPFYRGIFRRWIRAAKIEARRLELDVLRGAKFRCRAGSVVGYISPEGAVYFCEDIGESVGDLRAEDYDFRKVWFGDVAARLREHISKTQCSCAHSCFVGSSVLFDVSRYPRLMKLTISG